MLPFEGLSIMSRPADETQEPVSGKIIGTIPKWTKGQLILSGPAKWDFNGFTVNHWFDGCCMLTRLDVDGAKGAVVMEKKFLRTEFYKGLQRTGKPLTLTFGTKAFPDDGKNLISRIISNYIILEQCDNCSGIYELGDRILTCGETCFSYELDLAALKLKGERLDSNRSSSSMMGLLGHPQADSNGDVFNIGTSMSAGGVRTNVIRLKGNVSNRGNNKWRNLKELFKDWEVVASWPNRYPTTLAFGHSFVMTKNYIVHMDMPYYFTVMGFMSATVKGHSIRDLFKWHPEERNRFVVVEKSSGKIVSSDVEIISRSPFIFTHCINAYEEDNHIILDIITYSDPSIFDALFLSKLRNNILAGSAPSRATRFAIPVHALQTPNFRAVPTHKNLVSLPDLHQRTSAYVDPQKSRLILSGAELTSVKGMENPVVNPHFQGQKHSVFYASHQLQKEFFGKLGKFRVDTEEVVVWQYPGASVLGSPIFLPRPGGEEEEDGLLMVTVMPVESPDFLLFLDAKSFTEVARTEFPQSHIPSQMHSFFKAL